MVIVVGAGATGLGIAWDLVLRGIRVTVIEQGEVGSGTSGRFHGLLHSGARYAVTDPVAAEDCWHENQVLKRIAAAAIDDTGGYFVQTHESDEAYRIRWEQGMRQMGIPYRAEALGTLSRATGESLAAFRAFYVPDAVLEGFRLLQLLQQNIRLLGGDVLVHTRLAGVNTHGGTVRGVLVEGPDGQREMAADVLINAAGPWAQNVSALIGDKLSLQLSYGLMLIFAQRRIKTVVNRLREPGDGDIIVPHREVAILGTTDIAVDEPDAPQPPIDDVIKLWQLGKDMVPGIENWRVLRAFTGVRPLYAGTANTSDPRQVSRDFKVIDHKTRQGPEGAFSVVGGKWTTFRLMAEHCVDDVCRYLGAYTPCRTDRVPLRPPQPDLHQPISPEPGDQTIYCECESVKGHQLQAMDGSLDNWRTETWFSMGPCQGTVCAHRAVTLYCQKNPGEDYASQLRHFRHEREKGMQAAALGINARQWALQKAVRFQTLGESWDEPKGVADIATRPEKDSEEEYRT